MASRRFRVGFLVVGLEDLPRGGLPWLAAVVEGKLCDRLCLRLRWKDARFDPRFCCASFDALLSAYYQAALDLDPLFDLVVLPGWNPFDVSPLETRADFRSLLEQEVGDLEFVQLEVSNLSPSSSTIIDRSWGALSEVLKKTGGEPRTANHVALGGTFDHLHAGHKLMLSMALYVAKCSVLVGITGEALLQKKQYKEQLQPFGVRSKAVESFVKTLRPDLSYRLEPIADVYGPTAVEKDLELLVVSQETLSGAEAINKKRAETSLPQMEFVSIGLLAAPPALPSADGKLSSTALRKLQQEALSRS